MTNTIQGTGDPKVNPGVETKKQQTGLKRKQNAQAKTIKQEVE